MQTPPRSADRLRDGIDHGAGGDKVSFPDPAAAPLGTDDEAAGHPPTPEQLRQAHTQELTTRPEDESTGRARRSIGGLQGGLGGLRASGRALGILVVILVVLSILALL